MSRNLIDFVQSIVYPWIEGNIANQDKATFPGKDKFRIHPVSPGDPGYADILDAKLQQFKASKFIAWREIDGLGLAVLQEGDDVFVCGVYVDGLRKIAVSELAPAVDLYVDMSFLQKIEFLHLVKAKAAKPITRNAWSGSLILENDIASCFPEIICFSIERASANESHSQHYLRFLLSMELGAKNAKSLTVALIELMLSMPKENHEWLSVQLLSAVLSERNSNFFLELYRIAEFFFPMQKVAELKDRIDYKDSTLKLLEICMNVLGWHVNHQTGSRSAVNYADVEFARLMLGPIFPDGGSSEDERKHKEQAMEKITDIRHSLVHQKYKQNSFSDNDVFQATAALLLFLTSSFKRYNEELLKEAKLSVQ